MLDEDLEGEGGYEKELERRLERELRMDEKTPAGESLHGAHKTQLRNKTGIVFFFKRKNDFKTVSLTGRGIAQY